MNKLPPNQYEIESILKWNTDHPGIIRENPKINLKQWTLIVDGEVNNPLKLTWQDFINLPAFESINDFHCVEGWSVKNCQWFGVKFITIIDTVKPKISAKFVHFLCSDGYTTSFNIEELLKDNVILAYKLNMKDLEEALGGPMRLIVPDKYAYKSAMWVKKITFNKHKEFGYWEKRGYSDIADVWNNDRFNR